jgi:hypothetical protein
MESSLSESEQRALLAGVNWAIITLKELEKQEKEESRKKSKSKVRTPYRKVLEASERIRRANEEREALGEGVEELRKWRRAFCWLWDKERRKRYVPDVTKAMNYPFKGAHMHHMDVHGTVVFIPAELHKKYRHNLRIGRGMGAINRESMKWLDSPEGQKTKNLIS